MVAGPSAVHPATDNIANMIRSNRLVNSDTSREVNNSEHPLICVRGLMHFVDWLSRYFFLEKPHCCIAGQLT